MRIPLLLAVLSASALPIVTATAQRCDQRYSDHRSAFSIRLGSGFSPRGYAERRYQGSHSSRSHQKGGHSCGNDRIRLISGYQRGKGTRPSGWHDKGWFRKRGYNLDNYAHVHERGGAVHYGRNLGSSRGGGHSRHDDHRGHRH